MVPVADVAEFYGFDATKLNAFELEGYLRNIPRLAATRKRRYLDLHPDVRISADGMLELLRDETGNERLAQELASRYAESLLDKE